MLWLLVGSYGGGYWWTSYGCILVGKLWVYIGGQAMVGQTMGCILVGSYGVAIGGQAMGVDIGGQLWGVAIDGQAMGWLLVGKLWGVYWWAAMGWLLVGKLWGGYCSVV